MIDKNSLRLSAARAFQYNIPPAARLISVEVKGTILRVRALLVPPIDDEVKDSIFSAAGEIEGDFVELRDFDIELLEYDPSSQPPILDVLVFARSDVPSLRSRPTGGTEG
jgi:hypothetical protein